MNTKKLHSEAQNNINRPFTPSCFPIPPRDNRDTGITTRSAPVPQGRHFINRGWSAAEPVERKRLYRPVSSVRAKSLA
jgi:hypothetical protein